MIQLPRTQLHNASGQVVGADAVNPHLVGRFTVCSKTDGYPAGAGFNCLGGQTCPPRFVVERQIIRVSTVIFCIQGCSYHPCRIPGKQGFGYTPQVLAQDGVAHGYIGQQPSAAGQA